MESDHNPYTPPAAAVGDIESPALRERPVAVVVAIILIGIHILMSASSYVRVLHAYFSASEVNLLLLGIQVAKWLLLLLICHQLWRGRNWARILLLVMLAFALLALFAQYLSVTHRPPGLNYQPGAAVYFGMLLPSLTYLAASFLVFVPGRAWFRRRRRVGS
jgi:uncharacterized membrane protein